MNRLTAFLVCVAVGYACWWWGWWVGRSDSAVDIYRWKNLALLERTALQEQAKIACGNRTAYVNVETDKIHCGLLELWHPLKRLEQR